MAHITYFPRYTTRENVVTHTTLHLLSQIHQHSSDKLQQVLNELLGENEIPLGISFQQQMHSKTSVPDGSILQEPVHIVIETKVTAGINVDQLISHCESFIKGRTGNYLMLLTTNKANDQALEPVRRKAKEIGATFQHVPFEELCDSLKGLAEKHETHLMRVIDDYTAYCTEMDLLPDRRKRLRIVPCGDTFDLNKQWHVYYQPTDRSYSDHEYIGIYNQKAVRLLGKVSAIYDNQAGTGGRMQLKLFKGEDRPEFRKRIEGMVVDSKKKVGWDVSSGYRFFCADQFLPTDFEKTSPGGIQGPRFWDISEQVEKTGSDDSKLAELLRNQKWE
jgi:uncharacterized protein YbjQ (UPF0145 family)